MAKRQSYIEGIGTVSIAKRRGNTNLRLSIRPDGRVSLSMPYWMPYITGERFIKSRREWVTQQLTKYQSNFLSDGDLIGKSHRLYFRKCHSSTIKSRVTPTEIFITSQLKSTHPTVQRKAQIASEKALKIQAERLLKPRLAALSQKNDIPYKEARFRKLMSRWGSCSSHGVITLNIYLLQLPWQLIDYVILHELAHVKYLSHGKQFWQLMEKLAPRTKELRKQIKQYDPVIKAAGY